MSTYNPFYDEVKERNAMKSGAFLQEAFPGLSMAAISSRVFGQFVTTVRNYALRHGIDFRAGKGGTRITEETSAALEKWLSGESEPVTEESTEAVVVDAPVAEARDPEPEPATATKKPAEKFVVETLSAHISGTADDLLFYISAMLAGRSADVRIEMKFRKEEE